MPTSSDPNDLVTRWHELHKSGQTVSLKDLCGESPERVEELERHLKAVAYMTAFLGMDSQGGGTAKVASTPSPVATEAAGNRHVPGYEVLEELGRGTFGVVYKARHLKLERIVALKMVLAGGHAAEEDLERFRTDARAIARLQHPHVVQVFEVGEHEGLPFFSLEFCPGGSLERKLKGTPLPPQEAASLVQKLARGMQTAHEKGIVHRDLKPANVLLSEDGTPKISDFGLAKRLDETGRTAAGAVLGTPSYMAPEQAAGRGEEVGPAADVYALGAVLYECLTGRPPFRAANKYETLMQVLERDPVPPRQMNPDAPMDLETICLKCLQKEPGRRYATAQALAEELGRFQRGEAPLARPVGRLERAWRWCRRNPTVAASALVVALSLVVATVISILFGLLADKARHDEAEHAKRESLAKDEADLARRETQRQLIDLSSASGLTASREGDESLALLWFARAVELAKEEPEMEQLSRTRFANWRRQVSLPEGTFTVPGFQQARDRIRTFEFSPDGNYLLVISSNGVCQVWDRVRGQLSQLSVPAAQISAAAWVPGSSLLAVAGKDGLIHFLRAPEFHSTAEEVAAGEAVTVLAVTRDGKRLAWGTSHAARVWDRPKKEYVSPLLPHPQPVLALSFSATGDLLATSGRDSKVRVFRVAPDQGEPLFPPIIAQTSGEYGSNHGGADHVAPRFAAGDQVLLTVERMQPQGYGLIWRSATTGKLLGAGGVSDQEGPAAFAVNPQGNQTAVLWADLGRLWDIQTRGILAALPKKRDGWFEEAVFAVDGKTLVTGDQGHLVRFWSIVDRPDYHLAASAPAIHHPLQVVRVNLSSDGQHLAAALWDGRICLWRLPEGVPVAYSVPAGGLTLPVLSPDHRFVLPRGTSYRNGTQLATRVYHADSGKEAGPTLNPEGLLLDAAFSPDGTHVATASSTARTPEERNARLFEPEGKAGSVQIWDWKIGKRLAGPIPMPAEPRGLAFRPDGRTLAVVCADYRLLLVDTRTGSITHTLDPGVRSWPSNANFWWSNGEARFSPDGRRLVTWEMGPHVHVWDPDSGKLLHTLLHNERMERVAFSPTNPGHIATGGREATARIWDLNTGQLLVGLPHPGWVGDGVQFSPDGTELLTASAGVLRVWDWQAAKVKEALAPQLAEIDFTFTSDRRWLVAIGLENLQLTDWRGKSPAGPLWTLKRGPNVAIAIPAGNQRAIVGGFSGSLVAYDLEAMVAPATAPTDDLVRFAELVAGRRVLSQGNVVPLSSSEWAERWQRLQQTGSPLLQPTPGMPTGR